MSEAGRRNVVCAVWCAAGLLLIWRGLPYAGVLESPGIVGLSGDGTWIALTSAVVLGVGKGVTALRAAARRAATHIARTGATAPAWKLFSRGMLGLVVFFVGLGLILRLGPYDPAVKAWVVGIIYPAVGVALLIGGQFARTIAPAAGERRSAAIG